MGTGVAYENLTVAASAVAFTQTTIRPKGGRADPRCVVIRCEGADIRWRTDGTSPTASVGMLMKDGEGLVLKGEGNIYNIQFIRTASTSATVHGHFFSDINDAFAFMSVMMQGPVADGSTIGGSPVIVGYSDGTNVQVSREAVAGEGQLSVSSALPGASAVKGYVKGVGATSVNRATFLTPTSGKKVRIIAIGAADKGLSTNPDGVEFYFGTGANIESTAANSIGVVMGNLNLSETLVFPDGAGPVGAADAVVSWRTATETEGFLQGTLVYREE